MIALYLPTEETSVADFAELFAKGRASLVRRGRDPEAAIRFLFASLRSSIVQPQEQLRAATLLFDAFVLAKRPREAISVAWYLGAPIENALLDAAPAIDRARSLARNADAASAREAALAFESAGLSVKAAIAYERAGAWDEARALWSRLTPSLASSSSLYEAALASFNVCRTSLRVGDARGAKRAATQAVHLAEEAADRFESAGQRDRAFDSYQVLLAIGRETKTFEHVLEGYVNVLRILSEDHLRLYAMQTYAEAIEAARAEGELVAAATLAREMSAFARKEGDPRAADRAALTEASMWRGAAKDTLDSGGPKARAEHALLAAVQALGELGQYLAIGAVYAELAEIAPDERRREHYARAAPRYATATDERIDAANDGASSSGRPPGEVAFPDVWHVDLVEWEDRGSAAEACAGVLLDTAAYSEVTRRRALLARLVALSAESPEDQTTESLLLVAQSLTTLGSYATLAPLEALAKHRDPLVREGAARAMARLSFKRTFMTIRGLLEDGDEAVARAATKTLERMSFDTAIDPLARLYRESKSKEARHAALRALACIERAEAAEVLVSVVAYGSREDRDAATNALRAARGSAFLQAARAAIPHLDPQARAAIHAVLETQKNS